MKKIIFSEKSIRLSDSGKQIRARKQVRNLLHAVFWQEDFHWMDGFLIFDTWITGNQDKTFLALFRSVAAKASNGLENAGLTGATIIRNGKIDCHGYYRLKNKPDSNIEEAISLLAKARLCFYGKNEEGWNLISQAIKTANGCIDARAICQTLSFADRLPIEQDELYRIQQIIDSYRERLIKAVIKVGDKASKEDEKQRQGLDFSSVADTLARWVVEIVQVNEILDLFAGVTIPLPDNLTEDVLEFVRLASTLGEYGPKIQTQHDIDVKGHGEACRSISIEDELDVNMLQEQLVKCAFVDRITTEINSFYQANPWLKVKPKDVCDCLNDAVFEFAHKYIDALKSPDKIEKSFRQFLKKYVANRGAKKNISLKIFDAPDKSPEEKKELLKSLMENIIGKDNLKVTMVDQLAKAIRGKKNGIPKGLCNYRCCFKAFIEDRTRDFVGRKFVFDVIDDFVKNNNSGYFFVRGDPGIGKSSIITQLVKEREYVHHFNIRADGRNKADIFLKNICSQLIIDHKLEYSSLPPEALENGGFLSKLLREISGKLKNEEKVVIVIDALDEVDKNSFQAGANMLYLPIELPRGIFMVATTRRQTLNMRIECVYGEFDIKHDLRENREDIQEYLESKTNNKGFRSYIKKQKLNRQSFIEHMVKTSQGNFMYLHYVLPEIENGIYKDLQFEQLPVGLKNYYEDHWRRMGMRGKPLPKEKIKIVYILSEVEHPVSRELLADFSKEDEMTVQGVLDEWNQFLHKQKIDSQTRFSVYHNSFRSFLNRKEIVEAAGVNIEDINLIIGNNLYEDMYDDE